MDDLLLDELETLSIKELADLGREVRAMLLPRVPKVSQGVVNVTRGTTVAGTGKQDVVTDEHVRKLLADCRAAGATISRAANSHWNVEYEGRFAQVSSTPRSARSVLNDRSRVRRKLGLDV